MVSIKDPPPSLSTFLYYATSCSLGHNKVRRALTALPLAISLWSYLPTFTHSLAHHLASSAIPRVYSLERSLEPSPHYHSLTTVTVTSKGIVSLFFDNIFRLHGILDSVVSDHGTQFTSEFTRALSNLVGTEQKMSTSFHPQTDGQTECINALMEQYLQGYCNYQQDNWTELLTLAEFSYNNTFSTTTGMTPFRAMYGINPHYTINPNPDTKISTPAVIQEYADDLAKLDSCLSSEMTWAQASHSEQEDKHRILALKLEVGDQVWLLRRNLKTTWPSTKLDYKRLGKFKIIKKVSS